jgi:protein TonB|tara:strand:+ start:246 stop:896 length:651 start_codon:yes stop_codon:yes gene_type:complete
MRKKREADLRLKYNIHLQIGFIISITLFITIFNVRIPTKAPATIIIEEQEEIFIEEVIQTKQIETPPPPPRPPVPVEVPNDEIIEDEIIDLDTELDLDGPLDLPPPPPPKSEETQDDFFVVVEQMPQLIGGLASLQKKVKYPEMARRAAIEGRVTIQFIVNEQGEVENPRVIRGIGGGCDEEALKAVMTARFKPGMQRGRPVRVQYSLPIVFRFAD